MRVLNLSEANAEDCGCGTWLKHWENFSYQKANFCAVSGCENKIETGAKVQKEGEPGTVYVVPLCRTCAARHGESLEIVNSVHLVSTKVSDTCAKKKTPAVQVLNLTEGEDQDALCGSWLKHWSNFSQQKANFCMVVGCGGKPEVGGRVRKLEEPGTIYVVPLCRTCAATHDKYLEIVSDVHLVSTAAHGAH